MEQVLWYVPCLVFVLECGRYLCEVESNGRGLCEAVELWTSQGEGSSASLWQKSAHNHEVYDILGEGVRDEVSAHGELLRSCCWSLGVSLSLGGN